MKHKKSHPKKQKSKSGKPAIKLAIKRPAKKQKPQKSANIKTAAPKATAILPQPVKIFSFTRQVVVWGFVIIILFAVFSVLAVYSAVKNGKSPFDNKLERASTLSLLTNDEPIVLAATGDIMLARYVELKMRKLKDYTYPFQKVADTLKGADIAFGNLESPLFPGKFNTPKDSMVFRADLEGTQGLQYAGYDVVSVANNHTMNYQVPGLTSTLVELKKANILAAGGGKNQDAAHTPAIMEVKGKKIAFYAYNDPNIPPRFHGEAKSDYPGIAKMDIEAVKNDVKNAKDNGADIVIVSMHAGKEYKREPTQFQKDFAHAAIDAGASLVIGHHPHWVEPVERYGKGIILYSLGNFVFDQAFSEDVKTGLIARVMFTEDSEPALELLPVRIENTQPRILEGEEKVAELKRLGL